MRNTKAATDNTQVTVLGASKEDTGLQIRAKTLGERTYPCVSTEH
jgi:hypothetical protein